MIKTESNFIIFIKLHLDDIAYISWDATQFLERPLNRYKGFVLCATHEKYAAASSLYCARREGMNAFRPPFHRHIRLFTLAMFKK